MFFLSLLVFGCAELPVFPEYSFLAKRDILLDVLLGKPNRPVNTDGKRKAVSPGKPIDVHFGNGE
jgi:hypothetical protein